MKRLTTWGLMGVALVLATAAGTRLSGQDVGAVRHEGACVGVCNIARVFDEAREAKDLAARLNAQHEAFMAADGKRDQAIKALEAQVRQLKPGTGEYETRMAQVYRLKVERQGKLQIQDNHIKRQSYLSTQRVYDEILAAVKQVAAERSCRLVVQSEGPEVAARDTKDLLRAMERRTVLYSQSSIDLTQAVIDRLNAGYKAASGG